MSKIQIRHLVAKPKKDGCRYYWQPAKKLRLAGWSTRRLSDVREIAISEAENLNRELDDWRNGIGSPLRLETLPWLIRLYRSDDRFMSLAPATKTGYEYCLRVIENWSEKACHPPITSLERRHVKAFYRSMGETPSKANAVLRVLRLILAFAVDEGLLQRNPAERQRLKSTPPRQQVWSLESIRTFVATAKNAGRPSLGLAVLLGANLGQRQGDILKTRRHSKTVMVAVRRQRDHTASEQDRCSSRGSRFEGTAYRARRNTSALADHTAVRNDEADLANLLLPS